MQLKYLAFLCIMCSVARDPFVYQQKDRIVAEGSINGECIKVKTAGRGIKIERKKIPSTENS